MYGFYEQKPALDDQFVNSHEEQEAIDHVYRFDEDEGAWEIIGEESGRVHITFEDGEWVEI